MSLLGMQRLATKSGQSQYTEAWLLALQNSASLDDERQWVIGDNVSQQRQDPLVVSAWTQQGHFGPPMCWEMQNPVNFFRVGLLKK